MDIGEIAARATAFEQVLRDVKAAEPAEFWYPYGTLANFGHLERLLGGKGYDLGVLAEGRAVADIGAADGDLAFFLETLGYEVDIVDNAPTRAHGLGRSTAARAAATRASTSRRSTSTRSFGYPVTTTG